jgi:hypothetical protein
MYAKPGLCVHLENPFNTSSAINYSGMNTGRFSPDLVP